MNAKTLKALKASIEHWRENATRKDIENIKIGPVECALCGIFNTIRTRPKDRCEGCPVAEKTGASLCGLSPYAPVDAAHNDLIRAIAKQKKARADLRRACKAELKFLESLLPVSDKGAQP